MRAEVNANLPDLCSNWDTERFTESYIQHLSQYSALPKRHLICLSSEASSDKEESQYSEKAPYIFVPLRSSPFYYSIREILFTNSVIKKTGKFFNGPGFAEVGLVGNI